MKKIIAILFLFSLNSCENKSSVEPEVGNLVFWTKRQDVYFNNSTDANIIEVKLVGVTGSRFIFSRYDSSPSCIDDLTATFEFLSPGEYVYSAEDSNGRKWSGTAKFGTGCWGLELK